MSQATNDLRPKTPLIELREATVVRSGQAIVDRLSWTINEGEHWVILGPNGAGKTTIARLLSGRDHVDQGEVDFLGEPLADQSAADLASLVGLASIDVGQRLLSAEKVIDTILSAAWGQSIRFFEEYEREDVTRARDLLAALGVGQVADRPLSTLSEGERRRVLLARALMADPEVLILDEPTAGLDLGGRETLISALSEIMGSRTSPAVILITHELEVIGEEFTHGLLLRNGQVIAQGPLDTVLTDDNLSATFGLPLRVSMDDGRWRATAVR